MKTVIWSKYVFEKPINISVKIITWIEFKTKLKALKAVQILKKLLLRKEK
jgi:hypothetical protein